MRARDDGARTGVSGAGLCNGCLHQRVIESGKGSRFSMCLLAASDPRCRRYPPLPVLACDGFEPRQDGAAPVGGS